MVNVIGLGYIGLSTALMVASHGVEVVGTNHSQGKVDMLKSGHTTFKEKGSMNSSKQPLMAVSSSPRNIRLRIYIYRFCPDSV